MLNVFHEKLVGRSGPRLERPAPDTPGTPDKAPEREDPDRPAANKPDRSPEEQAEREEQRQLETGEESPG